MKLDDDFLGSMREAFARFQDNDPVAAKDVVQRALWGKTSDRAVARRPTHAEDAGNRIEAPYVAKRSNRKEAADNAFSDTTTEDRGYASACTYRDASGKRDYRLYIPAGYCNDGNDGNDEPVPLVVMLHGCTQDAADFAAGTRMDEFADQYNCIVAYPIQPPSANPSKCWNWFKRSDQLRDQGEPALIAGITRQVTADYAVDPKRVYVAGLSAGGAMAVILGQRYADLYAAIGVHSGLPAGCAHDLPSALSAMRGGRGSGASSSLPCPLIVFHGDADATVHYSNARKILTGFSGQETLAKKTDQRSYAIECLVSDQGHRAEFWTIHGAPHAWSGGSAKGTYTDPQGPDASAEMLRFFLANPKQ